jgi:hypothetical protein
VRVLRALRQWSWRVDGLEVDGDRVSSEYETCEKWNDSVATNCGESGGEYE